MCRYDTTVPGQIEKTLVIHDVDFSVLEDVTAMMQLIYTTFSTCNKDDSSEKLIQKYETLYGPQANIQDTIAYMKQSDICLLAQAEDTILGIIRGNKDKIINLYVSSTCQGLGLGKKLLDAFEQKAKALGSKKIILKSSKYAYNFYVNNGFRPTDTIYLEKHI